MQFQSFNFECFRVAQGFQIINRFLLCFDLFRELVVALLQVFHVRRQLLNDTLESLQCGGAWILWFFLLGWSPTKEKPRSRRPSRGGMRVVIFGGTWGWEQGNLGLKGLAVILEPLEENL